MKTALALSLALAGIAGASTITETCGSPVSFGNQSTPITGPQGPASFSCAALGVGATSTITQIQLFYSADFGFGSTPGTNSVVWTFNTLSGTWSGSNTETVTGGFSSSSNTPPVVPGLLDPPFTAAVVGPGQINTTTLGVGTSNFAGVNISALISITGGVISTTGDVFAQITYSTPTTGTPEPTTLGLMGGALLGLGFLARRNK